MEEREFLVLIRDKIDLLIPKISIKDPLIEISRMISDRLKELQKTASAEVAKK
jgi:hypothetical protein